jgi:hypothetical protein
MVSPVNTGYQPAAPQPAASLGPEIGARTQSIQPRSAPAADTQRADQRALESKDEQKSQIEFIDRREKTAAAQPTPSPTSNTGRGTVVDLTV